MFGGRARFFKLTQNILRNLPLNPAQFKRKRSNSTIGDGKGGCNKGGDKKGGDQKGTKGPAATKGPTTNKSKEPAVPKGVNKIKEPQSSCKPCTVKEPKCSDDKKTTKSSGTAKVFHNAFELPDFLSSDVFRAFSSPDEKLGPGADKCGEYKNPEYFSYHRRSFVDLQFTSLNIRNQRIKDDGMRCLYDADDESD